MRPLAVAASKRSPYFSDVPTISEAGYPGHEVGFWVGVYAPAGTPKTIIDRLWTEVRDGLAIPEVRERFAAIGVEVDPRGPEDFLVQLRELWATFGPVIKQLGIRAD